MPLLAPPAAARFWGSGAEAGARFCLFGAPLDLTGSGRRGTGKAPPAVRRASHQIESYSPVLDGDLFDAGLTDLGDLDLDGLPMEAALAEIERQTAEVLERPPTPRPPPNPPARGPSAAPPPRVTQHGAAAHSSHRLRRRHPLRGIPVSQAGEGEQAARLPPPSQGRGDPGMSAQPIFAPSMGHGGQDGGAGGVGNPVPIVVGGEHTIALAIGRAVKRRHPDAVIISLDAHLDLADDLDGQKVAHGTWACRLGEELGGFGNIVMLGVRSGTRDE
jgi:arginase family enzyme